MISAKMSLRLFSKKLLPKSFYLSRALNSYCVENTNRIVPSIYNVFNNFLVITHTSRRLYSGQNKPEEMIVDYNYVKKATTNNNILLVDVREPEEIKEHGKIPNSLNIPLGNVSTALNTLSDREFEETYGIKKPSEDVEIIFYCMIGKRSGMAQQNAFAVGYKNAKNYVGSWNDWASKNQ